MTNLEAIVSSPHARMASVIFLGAREAVGTAGMDREEFAAYLSAELEVSIPPEELEFWEIGGSGRGDAMLACAAVIREAVIAGLPVAAVVRAAAEQMSRELPRLPPGDPVRELLERHRDS